MSAQKKKTDKSPDVGRREFIKTAGSTAVAAPWIMRYSNVLGQGKKRNMIFIFIDDLRYDVMSCLDHPVVQTPNFDRMANGGILFKNAFVTTSLCSPSRASVLTGQYAHTHGVMDNSTLIRKGTPTFPLMLQRAGYTTGFVGKWHMGGSTDEPRPGFDRWVSFRGQGVYFNPTFNIDGEKVQREGYTTDLITDYALEFVKKKKERPFFLYMSHKAVHDPFSPAPRHKGKYKNIVVPKPVSFADTEENYRGKPEWVKKQRNSWHGVDGMYNNRYDFDAWYKDYCECVLGVDDSIGILLDTLEQEGLLEDTLIMFMGDNGFQFGEHGLIDKRTMYEPSIRVPFIVHCPALAAGGQRRKELSLNIDIAPTLLECAGISIPGTVQGKSLLPLIKGDEINWRTEFLYEYFWERAFPQTPSVLGLRTDQYSYMRYHGIWDLNELYDIQQDPDQMNNLMGHVRTTTEAGALNNRIKDPELKDLVNDLENRLFRILEKTGARREPTWRM